MSDVFADTSYFLALINPADRDYARARNVTERRLGRLITTDWVVVEVANAMSRTHLRPYFLTIVDQVRNDDRNSIIAAERSLLERGLNLFRSRPDKEWSLTDCISFVVMHDHGLHDALFADRHFQQAGFRALLLE